MKKRVFLRNYTGKKIAIKIPDFEKITCMMVQIVSGDEILLVEYDDQRTAEYDSSDDRMVDFLDDWYNLPKEFINEFSKFEGLPYECAEYINNLKRK